MTMFRAWISYNKKNLKEERRKKHMERQIETNAAHQRGEKYVILDTNVQWVVHLN